MLKQSVAREEEMNNAATTLADSTQTSELAKTPGDLALAYHQGEGVFSDMEMYTVLIGRHARAFGMSWGTLRDILRDELSNVVAERGPTSNSVASLLINGV
jgi:hypothetical protein